MQTVSVRGAGRHMILYGRLVSVYKDRVIVYFDEGPAELIPLDEDAAITVHSGYVRWTDYKELPR